MMGKGKRWTEFAVESTVQVLGFSTVGLVLLIFVFLLREGLPVLTQIDITNFLGQRWYPTYGSFGILPLLLGSVLVTVTAIVIALPLGLATAVCVREVAPSGWRDILKPL